MDKTLATKVENCKVCPKGSACSDEGVSDYNNYLCPAGSYCEQGTWFPIQCQAGTFRMSPGAYAQGPIDY